ncbi:MAG: pantetheine-phosphate adenylyltransferase [Oscillospiraceae bacterium]|nr:pantetheine-phosphate adenylyltransferase [Oscillospiraceae bacterium]
MTKAVYPGSFDPVTNGHLEIIRKAAALFDHVVVLVAVNAAKNCTFSAKERVQMLRDCTADMPNVTVDSSDGLVAHYAGQADARAIVKGLRAMSDFDAEFQQALVNRRLNPHVETVFIPAGSDSMFLSSGVVKQVCALHGDISAFVPPQALPQIIARLKAKS